MDKLEYVLTLAEEKNLTRAANRLYISQPSLTSYVNRLEASLGIKLFDRSVQPIEVTEAGRIYIEDMKKIHVRESNLQAKLDALKQDRRTITIGTPAVRAAYDLPRVLMQFMELHPKLNVTVDTRLEEELEKDVADGRVDVVLGMLSLAYSNIHYECVHENVVRVLIPRQLLPELEEGQGTPENPWLLDPACLNRMTMLVPRLGGGHHRLAQRILDRYGLIPQKTIRCGNLNVLYQLIGMGAGFLITTPEPFMEAFPQYTDRIAFCTLEQEQPLQKTYIGYQEDSPLAAAVQDFVKLLKQYKQSESRQNTD